MPCPVPASFTSGFWGRYSGDDPDECWEWQLSRVRGYGQWWEGGKRRYAHRLAWEKSRGPIPKGLCVLHRCDNRACGNPQHLFLGTRPENTADMVGKGRQARGERCNTPLTEDQAREIRDAEESQRSLARRFGVSQGTVSNIRLRKTWKYLA